MKTVVTKIGDAETRSCCTVSEYCRKYTAKLRCSMWAGGQALLLSHALSQLDSWQHTAASGNVEHALAAQPAAALLTMFHALSDLTLAQEVDNTGSGCSKHSADMLIKTLVV